MLVLNLVNACIQNVDDKIILLVMIMNFIRYTRILEQLGNGEFGVVNRGMCKLSSTKEVEVAIKTLNPNSTTKDRVRFLQEAAIMCQFDHENVIKLYGVVTGEPVMIVLEYMSHGDLKNFLVMLQPT